MKSKSTSKENTSYQDSKMASTGAANTTRYGGAGSSTFSGSKSFGKNKFIPYNKRNREDRKKIRNNSEILKTKSTIGAVDRGIRHLVGTLSISNKKSLRFPEGVVKLTKCLCLVVIHPFIFLCPNFRKLTQAKKI